MAKFTKDEFISGLKEMTLLEVKEFIFELLISIELIKIFNE